MPNRVDPARFIDKTFTRRKTFVDSVNDYAVMIDGFPAGRILQHKLAFGIVKWFWTITGPALPNELDPGNGYEGTLEEAQEAFKAKFWQWHRFAMGRNVPSTWHSVAP